MTNFALIDSSGALVRYQSFDGAAPVLAEEKGLRWVEASPPVYDPALQSPPSAVFPVPAIATAVVYTVAALDLAAILASTITAATIQIDADTDSIYGAVLGNRAQEYIEAEAGAKEYVAAGYTGTVPACVQCWATAKGWTATQAADDILATATAWRSAQVQIRAQRLAAKEAVRTATNTAGVATTLTTWAGFVATIRSQLGL